MFAPLSSAACLGLRRAFSFGGGGPPTGIGLESEKPIYLDHEPSIRELRPSGGEQGLGIPMFRIHHEALAAGRPFPAEPQIRAETVASRAVLHKAADVHARVQAVAHPSPRDVLV